VRLRHVLLERSGLAPRRRGLPMTVLQLGAALLWGVIFTAPLFLAAAAVKAGEGSDDAAQTLLFMIAMGAQVFACIAAYVAGGVRP